MRKARVLLVDDEIAFTGNLSRILSRRDFEVSAVNDGPGAIEAAEGKDFDVVILDLKMPGIDGIETLKRLKTRRPLLEVIILTAHGSIDSALDGLDHGAFDYATKPFSVDYLIERIRLAFERKLLHDTQVNGSPG